MLTQRRLRGEGRLNRKPKTRPGERSVVRRGSKRAAPAPEDLLPSVLDGLTRRERIVLLCLDELQRARGGRSVPTAELYGRVLEEVDLSVAELQAILRKLGAGTR